VSTQPQTPGFAHALDNFIAETDARTTSIQPILPPTPASQASPLTNQYQSTPGGRESRQEELRPQGFANSIDNMLGPGAGASTPQGSNSPPRPQQPQQQQKYLMVNVPPGTSAGSTLHVQVPGENRTLAVTVPPGVSSFRVAYTASALQQPPQQQQQTTQPSAENSAQSIGQKLLLVQVPPGTAPGTTLHVAVPDEPGRILAAQVPANVAQFHVAYEPRNLNIINNPPQQADSGSGPPPYMNPSFKQQHQSPTPGKMQMANTYNHQDQSNYQKNNNQGGRNSMGDYILPAVGAAALGTAAFATYEHFSHNNHNSTNNGFTTNGDDAGDFDF